MVLQQRCKWRIILKPRWEKRTFPSLTMGHMQVWILNSHHLGGMSWSMDIQKERQLLWTLNLGFRTKIDLLNLLRSCSPPASWAWSLSVHQQLGAAMGKVIGVKLIVKLHSVLFGWLNMLSLDGFRLQAHLQVKVPNIDWSATLGVIFRLSCGTSVRTLTTENLSGCKFNCPQLHLLSTFGKSSSWPVLCLSFQPAPLPPYPIHFVEMCTKNAQHTREPLLLSFVWGLHRAGGSLPFCLAVHCMLFPEGSIKMWYSVSQGRGGARLQSGSANQ